MLGVVESVKAASDIYTPIGGTVIAVNQELEEGPEKINQDPYDDGWNCRLRGCDPDELEQLMTGPDYEKYISED